MLPSEDSTKYDPVSMVIPLINPGFNNVVYSFWTQACWPTSTIILLIITAFCLIFAQSYQLSYLIILKLLFGMVFEWDLNNSSEDFRLVKRDVVIYDIKTK